MIRMQNRFNKNFLANFKGGRCTDAIIGNLQACMHSIAKKTTTFELFHICYTVHSETCTLHCFKFFLKTMLHYAMFHISFNNKACNVVCDLFQISSQRIYTLHSFKSLLQSFQHVSFDIFQSCSFFYKACTVLI